MDVFVRRPRLILIRGRPDSILVRWVIQLGIVVQTKNRPLRGWECYRGDGVVIVCVFNSGFAGFENVSSTGSCCIIVVGLGNL